MFVTLLVLSTSERLLVGNKLKAAINMFRNRIRRIPVADNGKLVGIVNVGDSHKAIFRSNLDVSWGRDP